MNQFWQDFLFPIYLKVFGEGSIQGSNIEMTLQH